MAAWAADETSMPGPNVAQGGQIMDQNNKFEIPTDMRAMAQAGFDQARKAFEGLLSAAQRTANSLEGQGAAARASAKDVAARALGFAEANVRTSLDYAEKLARAQDISEIMRLHGEYVQSQMKTLAEQAGDISQTLAQAAMDAAKPKS